MILIYQMFRFAIVGIVASLVSYLITLLLISFFGFHSTVAFFIAYLFAFQVSFFGHKFITFRQRSKFIKNLPKFFLLSLFSLLLSELLLYLFAKFTLLSAYIYIILVIIFVAIITFIISKIWVFK